MSRTRKPLLLASSLSLLLLNGCFSPPSIPRPPSTLPPVPPYSWDEGPSGKIEYGFWEDIGNYGRKWRDGDLLKAPPLPPDLSPSDLPSELRSQYESLPKAKHSSVVPSGRDAAREEVARWGGVVGWVGNSLLVVSLLGCAASFIPFVGRYVTWQSATMVVAVSIAMKVLQYLILVYAIVAIEVGFWLLIVSSLVMGAALIVPWVQAFYRRRIASMGVQLAASGDVRAGVALMAAGDSKVNQDRKVVAQAIEDHVLIDTRTESLMPRDLQKIVDGTLARIRS